MSFKVGESIRGAGTPGHGYPTWIPNIDSNGNMVHLHLKNITIEPSGRHYHATVERIERVHPELTAEQEADLYRGAHT